MMETGHPKFLSRSAKHTIVMWIFGLMDGPNGECVCICLRDHLRHTIVAYAVGVQACFQLLQLVHQ